MIIILYVSGDYKPQTLIILTLTRFCSWHKMKLTPGDGVRGSFLKGAHHMEFMNIVKERYSCRKYREDQIKKEHLDVILEAGRLAPTAKNLQEQRIYVVQSEDGLATIDA